ncbi:MAG: SDR family NAD(P)-dependent oxidoreductase [Promethearchaeota archaeon]
MSKNILVIGGAGFIGSHLVDNLIERKHDVIVFDNLEPQVHGNLDKAPEYFNKKAILHKRDLRDKKAIKELIKGVDVIFHLAAMVGVAQSMYQIEKYYDVNVLGTAKLLDLLIHSEHDVNKLIVASSMSTYGEGRYICENCGKINPKLRDFKQLQNRDWELNCPICGKKIEPIPTDEEKEQMCSSIYALTKKEQEKMCMLIGEVYGINTTALRFFNVYGSRQSLSNPYTGVCAIFSSNLLNGNPPRIYEDGEQTRDFVHVKDVCNALILSMEKEEARNEVFNVGTGIPISIKKVAETLRNYINPNIKPIITNQFRPGDIRHCFADISKIKRKLGYKPQYNFEDGMKELIEWVKSQKGKVKDKSDLANKELKEKGLIK